MFISTIKTNWVTKLLSAVMVFSFTFDTIAWAYPQDTIPRSNTTLRPQSIIENLQYGLGDRELSRLRFEVGLVAQMIAANPNIPGQNITAALNDLHHDPTGTSLNPFYPDGRKLTILSGAPVIEKDEPTVIAEISNGKGSGKRFKIGAVSGMRPIDNAEAFTRENIADVDPATALPLRAGNGGRASASGIGARGTYTAKDVEEAVKVLNTNRIDNFARERNTLFLHLQKISQSNISLINPSTVQALKNVLDRDKLDALTSQAITQILSYVSTKRSDLFLAVYILVRELISKGKSKHTKEIVNNIFKVDAALLNDIEGEDWPIILRTISPDLNLNRFIDSFREILLSASKDKQNTIAIAIKQEAYREFKAYERQGEGVVALEYLVLQEYLPPPDKIPSYIGAYKLPWYDFCKLMDDNYDKFHKNPENFSEDIGNVNLAEALPVAKEIASSPATFGGEAPRNDVSDTRASASGGVVNKTIENKDWEKAEETAKELIRNGTTDPVEITTWIEDLVGGLQGEIAESVAISAIDNRVNGLNLSIIGEWANIISRISLAASEDLRKIQKSLLGELLKDGSRIQSLFNSLHARFPSMSEGMSYDSFGEDCLKILNGDKTSGSLLPKREAFLNNYFKRILTQREGLTEQEAELIRVLSTDITRTVTEARKSRRLKNVGEVSFREGVRFMKIFSRYYLKDMDMSVTKSRVFDYFTLAAWAVYGRFIRYEDREEFADILKEIFMREAYKDLFVDVSLEKGKEMTNWDIMEIFDNGRFDAAQGDENLLDFESNILAAVERARAASMPAFLFVPAQYFNDGIIDTLSNEPDSFVFPISMSGFTQRKELFGMHLPDSKGDVRWLSGAISRVADFARGNPDKQVYFVLENPDFSSGDVRMALHQMLLERRVTLEEETDESGKKKPELELPNNLQIVLTMEDSSDVGDESFMDRVSGCHLKTPDEKETKEYLIRKIGLPEEAADYLVNNVFTPLKKETDVAEKLKLQDIIQIGYYLAGRIRDNDLKISIGEAARQEAILHLEAKFSPLRDSAALRTLHTILGDPLQTKAVISADGKTLIFGGIRLEIDPTSRFAAYVADKLKNTGSVPSFAGALEEFLPKDYFLTPQEERIFCLLARVYKYGPSKVVFLQGLPGGGKTTIARIFLDITGCGKKEFTLNKEADLSLFRGSLGLTADGLEMRTPEYWQELPDEKSANIWNEADTRVKLLQWLWPNICGRPYRLGWEFASSDPHNPMGRVEFGKDRIDIFTGNARKDMPAVLGANMPATYCMERSEDDMRRITEKLFLSRYAKISEPARRRVSEEDVKRTAELLSKIYNSIADNVRKEVFTSKREVTPRQIERFANLLFLDLENNGNLNDIFKSLLHVVFVAMWDNKNDMLAARQIIKTQVTDLPPPQSSKELIYFAKQFPLDIPVLLLTNGTVSFEDIRKTLTADDARVREEIVPLSRFHTKKSIIGGLNRAPGDPGPVNKLGIFSSLILSSHLNEERLFCWLPGYLNLNPQVAPFLNEFFQTNWLSVEEVLDSSIIEYVIAKVAEKGIYGRLARKFEEITGKTLPDDLSSLSPAQKEDLACFLIGYKPENLIFRAIGTAEEKITLHAADIDRFFTINVSEEFGRDWIRGRVNADLAALPADSVNKQLALKCAEEAFRLYEEEKEDGLYPHIRLSPADIRIFLDEISKRAKSGELNDELIKVLAYHIIGMGLTKQEENSELGISERDYRQAYLNAIGLDLKKIRYHRDFITEGGRVFFAISAKVSGKDIVIARSPTRYESAERQDNYGRFIFKHDGQPVKARLQAPLQSLLAQEASTIIFNSHGMGVSLEGDPGGGKTSGSRDIGKATGRPYHEEGMYRWITLGSLLGSLSIRGNEIVLNTLDKDANGRYLLPFLRMYEEGGNYVTDEGMVSKGAGYLIQWIIEAGQMDEIDLGTYHPGLQDIIVKRHPDFTLTVTQNDHFKTAGRKPLPVEVDTRCGKVRVDNVLSQEDALSLIDYYLEGYPIDADIKTGLAELHILLSGKHPQKRMISPRDLIDTIQAIKGPDQNTSSPNIRELLGEGISVNYLEGLVDSGEKALTEELIREVFPWFQASDYRDTPLVDKGYSNIDPVEAAHLKGAPTMLRKARAMEKMLISEDEVTSGDLPPSRQVLINEADGISAVEFLKLFCHLTGRYLDIVEGHPFVTAKLLLAGESFEFEKEFDDTGKRRAKSNFIQTHGALRRYLVKKEDLSSLSPEDRKPVIIAITNVESIPKNELVRLNELIATRSATLQDENGALTIYTLPPWITIVPITSDIDRVTSPFANRFKKLGLASIEDKSEIHGILAAQYPNLKPEETDILLDITKAAEIYCDEQRFEIGYDFTMGDMNELVLRLQMYKQLDNKNGTTRDDPLWYVIKAANYVLLRAMCPQDRLLFRRSVLEPLLTARLKRIDEGQARAYLRELFEKIRAEDRVIDREDYEHHISLDSLKFKRLPNGIKVKKLGDTLTIITDSKAYELSLKELSLNASGEKLSEDLTVSCKDNILTVRKRLISSIGISSLSKDRANLERALPPAEMGIDDFMYPADSLIESINALLQAHTPVETATGRLIRPRVVLMAGQTGSGKTTIPRMLSKAEGTPLVRINPWRQMHAAKLTVSLSFGETIEMSVADFLLACGKINGKRITTAYPTSNRVRILIDEANITRDVWYVLDAIARGEKKFKVETPAGDVIEAELDTEVEIVLTYNPPERYGGTGKGSNRYKFPSPLARKSVKVYTSEPLEDYSDPEMYAIMQEIYRRGEAYFDRENIIKKSADGSINEQAQDSGFFPVEDEIFKIKHVDLPDPMTIDELAIKIGQKFAATPSSQKMSDYEKKKKQEEIEAMLQQKLMRQNFSPEAVREAIDLFLESSGRMDPQGRFGFIIHPILLYALAGIALEKIEDGLLNEVIALAGKEDPDLAALIQRFSDICKEDKTSEKEVMAFMSRLENICRKHKIYLEGLETDIIRGRPVLNYEARKIRRSVSFDSARLKDVLGDDNYRRVFGDHLPDVLVIERPDDGTLGYYDGRDMVCASLNDEEKEIEVASHELGHLISDTVAKNGDEEIAKRTLLNVELYSHLFPIMLAAKPKKYINETLLEKITNRRGDDDAYALACAAVLNAFCIEYAMPRIDNEFGQGNIDQVVNKINGLGDDRIKDLATEFWRNPKQYFPDVKRGEYYKREIIIKGGPDGEERKLTLSEGPVIKPRIKIIESIEVEAPEDKAGPEDTSKEFIEDDEKVKTSVSVKKDLPPASLVWMRKYEQLFAPEDNGDDLEVRYVSEGGTDINPEAWAARRADELLTAPEYEDDDRNLAQNVFFIIDVSGSITSNPDLQDALEAMIYNYASLLLELSRKNPELNIGVASISTKLHVLFDFNDWKQAKSHAARAALIKEALQSIWHSDDSGGIDTPALLDSLSQIDFPSTTAKDVKNMVVVLTDGQETGRADGMPLQDMVRSFREGRFIRPDGKAQVQTASQQYIDMAFIGVELKDGGAKLRRNYPCFLICQESTDAYLEALFKMGYMQAKGIPLEGDLSETIRQIGQKGMTSHASARLAHRASASGSPGEKIDSPYGTRKGLMGNFIHFLKPLVNRTRYVQPEHVETGWDKKSAIEQLEDDFVWITWVAKKRVKRYEKILNGDFDNNACKRAAFVLGITAYHNRYSINFSTVQSLANALNRIELNSSARKWVSWALATIAEATARVKTNFFTPSIIQTIEDALNCDGLENDTCAHLLYALYYIPFSYDKNLIKASTVQAIGYVLNRDVFKGKPHKAATLVLGEFAERRPDLFLNVYVVIKNLVSKGRNEAAEKIANSISKVYIKALKNMKDEDWPIILRTIKKRGFRIPIKKFRRIILSDSKYEQDSIAISIKQSAYRSLHKGLKIYSIPSPDKIPLYMGIYKYPWKDFCEFMDKNYKEFHEHPEEFAKPIDQIDISVLPPKGADKGERTSASGEFTNKQLRAIERAKKLLSDGDKSFIERFNVKNFGLDPSTDKTAIIKIAKLCAQEDGEETAANFENFGLDPSTDKAAIIEIAKLCAQEDGGGTTIYFDNFGLDPKADKTAIIEIAKLCAQQDGWVTADHFYNFGLNVETDISSIIEIYRLCHAQDGGTDVHFYNFGFPIDDMTSLAHAFTAIKGKDWPFILGNIGTDIGFEIPVGGFKKIILSTSKYEQDSTAISIKQASYRKFKKDEAAKDGKSVKLKEHLPSERDIPLYMGTYKLPWKDFCEFMDKHYKEFHEHPENFSRPIEDMDISGLPPMTDEGINTTERASASGRGEEKAYTAEDIEEAGKTLTTIGLKEEFHKMADQILIDSYKNDLSIDPGWVEWDMANKRLDRIKPSTVQALEYTLYNDHYNRHRKIISALRNIPRYKPTLILNVFSVIMRLIANKRMDYAQEIIDDICNSHIDISNVAEGKDWPIILGSIDENMDTEFNIKDFRKLFLGALKDKQSIIAISIKQAAYRKLKKDEAAKDGKSVKLKEHLPSERDIPLYMGTYKLPWKDFCEFMDKHYKEFHEHPENFSKPIEDMDISSLPPIDKTTLKEKPDAVTSNRSSASGRRIIRRNSSGNPASKNKDINVSKKKKYYQTKVPREDGPLGFWLVLLEEQFTWIRWVAKRQVKRYEFTLNHDGFGRGAYTRAIERLFLIFHDNKDLITSSTIEALKNAMARDGLERYVYDEVCQLLAKIASNNKDLNGQIVRALEDVLNVRGLYSYSYDYSALALSKIAKDRPDVIQRSTVKALENILNRKGLISNTYMYSAWALSDIANNSDKLSDPALTAIENISNKEGLDNDAYGPSYWAIYYIAKKSPALIRISTLQILENVLNRKELYVSARWHSALALAVIAKKLPEIIRDSTVQALGNSLHIKELGIDVHQSSANALSDIAKNDHNLSSSALKALENVLNTEGLDGFAYSFSANALSDIAKNRPMLTLDIFSIIMDLVINKKIKRAKEIIDALCESSIDISSVIEGKDWPIILSTIDKDTGIAINIEDFEKIFLSTLKTEQNTIAISIKQAAYRSLHEGYNIYTINAKNVSSYMGMYKRSWKDFCEFMDKHYKEFHEHPEEFAKPIDQIDISVLPPKGADKGERTSASGQGKEKKEYTAEDVEEAEKTLNTVGLSSETYMWVGASLDDIAVNHIALISPSTVQALENVLNRDGLDGDAYNNAAWTLGDIAKNNEGLIKLSTVHALENALNNDCFNNDQPWRIPFALCEIARNKPAFIFNVFSIIMRLIANKKMNYAKEMIDTIYGSHINISDVIENRDWPIILRGTDENVGAEVNIEDFKKLFSTAPSDEKNAIAISIKQAAYRSLHEGYNIYTINAKNVSSYMGMYKRSWKDFCEFMDKHYKEFHEHPENFSKPIEDMDISGLPPATPPILQEKPGADTNERASASGQGMGKAYAQRLKSKFKLAYWTTEREINRYENILNQDNISSNTCGHTAWKLYNVIANNAALIKPSTVQAFENILSIKGLESTAYGAPACPLSYIAKNRPELIQPSTILAIGNASKVKGLEEYASKFYSDALSDIAQNRPDLADSAIKTIENILNSEELEYYVYDDYIRILSDIAQNKPALIRDSTIDALENGLNRYILDDDKPFWRAFQTLKLIAKGNPSLVLNVFSVIMRFIDNNRMDCAQEIIDLICESSIDISSVIEGRDWPIILSGTDENIGAEVNIEDFKKLFSTARSDEKNAIAISIKQAAYRSLHEGYNIYTINAKNVSSYMGMYKRSWKDFCEFMDKNYKEFHEHPEEFAKPIDQIDISVLPPKGADKGERTSTRVRRSSSDDSASKSEGGSGRELAIRRSCMQSIGLIKNVEAELLRLAEPGEDKKLTPVDIEVDLSLIEKENAKEYAQMWAYLIMASSKYENVNFIFTTPEYPNKESLSQNIISGISKGVSYEDFRELLSKEISGKAATLFMKFDTNKYMQIHVKGAYESGSAERINIMICPKERLEWMRNNKVSLDENQYPVALYGSGLQKDEATLRNFEAALAIGLCQAALVIAKKSSTAKGNEDGMTNLKKRILEKLEKIHKIFIKRGDFTMDEKTLSYMISPCSETRIDLAIYHALPPIVRLPIESIREKIKLANLYLLAA